MRCKEARPLLFITLINLRLRVRIRIRTDQASRGNRSQSPRSGGISDQGLLLEVLIHLKRSDPNLHPRNSLKEINR